MRYPKATLRRNGNKMMTATVQLHIDRYKLTEVLVDALRLEDEQDRKNYLTQLTKAKLWERTISTYTTSGINWFPEGLDVEEVRDTLGDEITATIAALFPELCV